MIYLGYGHRVSAHSPGRLELVVFLLQLPKCCDYRQILKFSSVIDGLNKENILSNQKFEGGLAGSEWGNCQ